MSENPTPISARIQPPPNAPLDRGGPDGGGIQWHHTRSRSASCTSWLRRKGDRTAPTSLSSSRTTSSETVKRLAELIIPADESSGSALEAGAPEFIDLLCSQNQELARMFTGGLLWLDQEMNRRQGRPFVNSGEPQQHLLLTALAQEARHQERRERASRNAGHRLHPSDP